MKEIFRYLLFIGLGLSSLGTKAFARGGEGGFQDSRIPDEYESSGGHSLGFGRGGVAAFSDISSVRTNPAMIAIEKQYRVSANYHWPTLGRPFYQVGVVDSQTSPVAAGVNYTGYHDPYKPWGIDDKPKHQINHYYDSLVQQRIVGAFAYPFALFAFGAGVQYSVLTPNEQWFGASPEKEDLRGVTVNAGLAGLLRQDLRFGLSAENMGNEKLKNFAPRTYRASLAYLFHPDLTAHLDFLQRERVLQETQIPDGAGGFKNLGNANLDAPERLGTLSASARVQDLLRLMASYGRSFDGMNRQVLSGGIGLVNESFSLTFALESPYLSKGESLLHEAINVSFGLAL